MLSDLLIQIDFLDERMAAVEAEIESKLSQLPVYAEAVALLDTIPGVNRMAAATIIAEIGVDMTRFPSDRHLTAWAGVAERASAVIPNAAHTDLLVISRALRNQKDTTERSKNRANPRSRRIPTIYAGDAGRATIRV